MGDWLFFKKIDIVVGGELYLRRWVIARTPWGQLMLHKILKPDPDRELHDHPWPFKSLILKGGYTEQVKYRGGLDASYLWESKAWETIEHNENDYHRIAELKDGGPTWTLVLTGKKRKMWHFLVDGVPMPWRQFLAMRGTPPATNDDW